MGRKLKQLPKIIEPSPIIYVVEKSQKLFSVKEGNAEDPYYNKDEFLELMVLDKVRRG